MFLRNVSGPISLPSACVFGEDQTSLAESSNAVSVVIPRAIRIGA